MMTRVLHEIPLLVIGCCAVSFGFANERVKKPNVLFLLSDDQRPDTIAALGNSSIQTPNLDRLVREGTTMTRAVSANPICTPSRAEILTGCSGFRNHVLDFGGQIDKELATWPDTMRAVGYHTWYVGKWHNDGRPTDHGFQRSLGLFAGGGGRWAQDRVDFKGSPITGYRGWVFQDDARRMFPERGVGLTPEISKHFADAAIELIRHKPAEPFFLQVNFTAPHDPLLMPPGYDDRYDWQTIPLPKNFVAEHPFDHGNLLGRDERLLTRPHTRDQVRQLTAMYYCVITHMDEQIGRILQALEDTGQGRNTIVIFSSDQGVALGSHGLRGKQNMYEHTIGVPLVLRGPGIPPGRRRAAQVYLRDLFPTVCDLTGTKIPESVEGRSFAGVLRGREETIHPTVFCYFRDKQRMVRTDRWKLIHYPQIARWQLFDLENDPHEIHDLVDDAAYADVTAHLKAKLVDWQQQVGDPLLAKSRER